MDNIQLLKSILNFSLDDGPRGNQGYSRVLLQLFGFTGHGKSSFINSCKYVIDGGEEYIEHAEAGLRDTGSLTMERKDIKLTENITIVDNRGYPTMKSFESAEIYAQLGNFIPVGKKVEWTDNYTDMMNRLEDAELDPNYSDFIVPILIYSAAHKPPSPVEEDLREFTENCQEMTGKFPIVVVTRKNFGVFNDIKEKFNHMGAKIIIPIENYTKEDHEKTQGRTEDILTIIHKALRDVTFHLEQERDPRRDWVQRKKFLLQYIYKADLEKEKEQWRREEERTRAEEKREEERTRAEEKREEERRREEERKRKICPIL